MNLSGKTALITGGAKGLGRGFAEAVLEQGGNVVLVDLLHDEGYAAARELNDTYGLGRAMFIRCDVANEEQLREAFEKTKKCYGYIDIVANNAGIGGEHQWRKMIEINMVAVIRGSELAVECMSTERGGRGGLIINTSSTAGLTGTPFEVVYSATKHAVVGATRSLALRADVTKGGIRVCCLCPSFTKTGIMNPLLDTDAQSYIGNIGIMEVSDVVKSFMKIVEWEDLTGGVVAVTPKGIRVIHPRTYKARL